MHELQNISYNTLIQPLQHVFPRNLNSPSISTETLGNAALAIISPISYHVYLVQYCLSDRFLEYYSDQLF